jgi:hypothetical protein
MNRFMIKAPAHEELSRSCPVISIGNERTENQEAASGH